MRFQEKQVRLADGRICVLKSLEPADAQRMLDYLKRTAAETHFMLRLPEEVTMTVEEESSYLESSLKDPGAMMINALVEGELAGNVGINPQGLRRKIRHRAGVGIALVKEYWGMGLGRLLMEEAVRAASAMGYSQLELGVYGDNERAIRLYEKLGFEPWGRIRNAFRLPDGTVCDEILMGLLLE